MFTSTDLQALRSQGTSDREILEMTAKVIPSAYKALRSIDADTTTPEERKNQIMREMVDRNVSKGSSMLPYISSLMKNSATKKYDNLQKTYEKEEKEFSLVDTAKLTAKRVAGGLASVPQALLYPVVQGARAADWLASKSATPFTGKEYPPLVEPEKVEEIRQQSWRAAPTAAALLTTAGGLGAGLSIPAISTKASLVAGGSAALGELETGGTIKNAVMSGLINGLTTKGLMTLNPAGATATALGADVASRAISGQELDSPEAAESYISSAALGYIGGRANKIGNNASKFYQKQDIPVKAPLGQRLQTQAQEMYQSALKPSQAILKKFPDVVKTGLEEGIPVTKSGLERVSDQIDFINIEIGKQIESGKKEGKVVLSSNVAQALSDTVSFYEEVIGGKQSVKELQNMAKEFVKDEGNAIPIERAQKLKVNTYKVLRKAYGEMKGVEIEGKKDLARGLKEEIVKALPELEDLNKRESQLVGLENALEKFVNRYNNRDLADLTSGIGGAVGASLDGAKGLLKGFAITKLAKMAIDNPSIKSRLAILLNEIGKKLSPVLSPEQVPENMEIINLRTMPTKEKTIQSALSTTDDLSSVGKSVGEEIQPSQTTLPQETSPVKGVERVMDRMDKKLGMVDEGLKTEAKISGIPDELQGLNNKFSQQMKKMDRQDIRRMIRAEGEAGLASIENKGMTPTQVVDKFWNDTYDNLPKEGKANFDSYIKAEYGKLGLGDENLSSRQLFDKYNGIIGDTVDDIFDTERGLLVLMDKANESFNVQGSKILKSGEQKTSIFLPANKANPSK